MKCPYWPNSNPVVVTAHAVDRYLERWLSLPREEWTKDLRGSIVGDLTKLIDSRKLEVCTYSGKNSVTLVGPEGLHLVVAGSTLKTVLPRGVPIHGGKCSRCTKLKKRARLSQMRPSERRRVK